MKKTLIFALLFALLSHSSQSQTTLEEYNYITGGDNYQGGLYRVYAEGADIKKGYKLEPAIAESKVTFGGGWKSVKIHFFKKDAVNKAFVLETNDNGGGRRFLCIPAPGSSEDIWNRAFSQFSGADERWKLTFLWALSKLASAKLL